MPSEVILNSERIDLYNSVGRGNSCALRDRNKQYTKQANLHGINMFNYVFADGHCKTMDVLETGGLPGDWGMWSINPDD